jgi:hypothetical protein
MTRSRALAVPYLFGAALFGVPGALLVGGIMLNNSVSVADACQGVYWCGYNAYGLLGVIPLGIALWFGDRGLDYWRKDE